MLTSPVCRAIIFGNMSDFDGIPAAGNALVDDDEKEVGSGEESEEVGRDGMLQWEAHLCDLIEIED